ncbi:MAG: endonuclease VIII [Candidatus Aminicenantes bacterium]|nr:endonuclease VIII [Candidatus Aminicenantes bacterium]
MIEIPESLVLANQLNQVLKERTVADVTAWQSPHKLAFIYGDPSAYGNLFKGQTFERARGFGSWVEIQFKDAVLAVSEGTRLFHTKDEKELPKKHQMLLKFDDGSFMGAAVKMYGAVVGARPGEYDNKYYLVAQEKPAVFSKEFSSSYFKSMIDEEGVQKLSLKAFLATEQRIPGLGNGVLQDILFNSRLHPKEKVKDVTEKQRYFLYQTLVSTLKDMTGQDGRDTEKDLFGNYGGYQTKMSAKTKNQPCPVCGTPIVKASYMGGSIYFCPKCQPLSSRKK